jgi:hypothetical protein
MKNVSSTVRDALLRIARGDFEPGAHLDDAASGGIGLAPFHDNESVVPYSVRRVLDTTLAGLAAGTIVPDIELNGR